MKLFKKASLALLTVSVVAVCMMLCAANVSAAEVFESGQCGDSLTWTLYDDGELVIDGAGSMWDFSDELPSPWYAYNKYITNVTIGNQVTSIGDYAFRYSNIESIYIGENVQKIKSHSLHVCPNLKQITVNENNHFFSGSEDGVLFNKDKTQLILYPAAKTETSYSIPNSVEVVDPYAFSYSNFTTINIPASVRFFRDSIAFNSNLTNCIVDNKNSWYCTDEFGVLFNKEKTELLRYPAGRTEISYTVPNSVTSIDSMAFDRCRNLTEITIPNSVTHIGTLAFQSCAKLTSITLPDSLSTIGEGAFNLCVGLTNITIPCNCSSIGEAAFSQCYGLTELTVLSPQVILGSDLFESFYEKIDPTFYGYAGSTTEDYAMANGHRFVSLGEFEREITHSGKCGNNLTWVLYNDGELVLSGEGAMQNYTSLKNLPWESFRLSIKSITIEKGVTTIGDLAFYDCQNLVNITISDSVTSIGNSAFFMCYELTNITIPDSVTSIGNSAFFMCYELTNITIPDSVTSIGNSVFYSCVNLTSITVAANNPNYSSNTEGVLFDKNKTLLIQYPLGKSITSYTIPDSVTSIGGSAFSYCEQLTTITLPDSVTSIGDYAFSYCKQLTTITLPDSITSIGDSAFSYCEQLTTITIPDSITSIGDSAFSYCEQLTTITIPASVKTLNFNIFYGCVNLKNVTILSPDIYFRKTFYTGNYPNLTLYGYARSTTEAYASEKGFNFVSLGEFEREITHSGNCGNNLTWVLYNDGEFVLSGEGAIQNYTSNENLPWEACRLSIRKITIEKGVTTIGDHAFDGCKNLINVSIPDSVTEIGNYTFYSCDNLTSFTVATNNPNYSSDTEGVLFDKNKTLLIQYPSGKPIIFYTIPGSVTSIGNYAFSHCEQLTNITIPASVAYIGDCAFYYCEQLEVILIPANVTFIGDCAFSYCENLEYVSILSPNILFQKNSITGNHPNLTLYGYAGSTTETYASEKGFNFVSLGEFKRVITHYGKWGDNLTWALYNDGEFVLSGKGAMQNYTSDKNLPWEACRPYIRSITIEKGITTIGDYIFDSCQNLTIVSIPGSVISIGNSAFSSCGKLKNVTILSLNTSFQKASFMDNHPNLTLYGYAGSTTETYASEKGFNFVSLGEFEREITHSGNCGNYLTWVLYDDGEFVLSGKGAMQKFISYQNLPWKWNRSSIRKITIEKGVTTISDYSFIGCQNLTNVSIPDSVTEIGDYAFANCQNLTNVSIPDSVTSIGDAAFNNCSSLTSVTILSHNANFFSVDVFLATPANLTLYGYLGSTTEAYAAETGRTFVALDSPTFTPGDINGDSSVDISDALYLFMHSMLEDQYPIDYPGKIDFNNDNSIDIADALHLFMYSMLPEQYPLYST